MLVDFKMLGPAAAYWTSADIAALQEVGVSMHAGDFWQLSSGFIIQVKYREWTGAKLTLYCSHVTGRLERAYRRARGEAIPPEAPQPSDICMGCNKTRETIEDTSESIGEQLRCSQGGEHRFISREELSEPR